jgi:hypothetical protein
MKNTLYAALAVIMMASCATPRYSYHFDTYDYNSGRKTPQVAVTEINPIAITPADLSADASPAPAVNRNDVPETVTPVAVSPAEAKETFAKKYSEMSKSERREFRREVKEQIKSYSQSVREGDGVKAANEMNAMDNDLKLAIIFGAVGLTLTLFGGINEAFWILGVISIVVGVVFLIKWLVRQ